jgi:hypothetical protein
MAVNTSIAPQSDTDLATRVREIRHRLPGQRLRERLELARLTYGRLYTREEIARKVAETLPQRLGFVRRATFEPIETYQAFIPDEALLKYDDAVKSGLFTTFSVVTPTYFAEKQVDPWIVGQIDGAPELYAVIAQWDERAQSAA